MIRSMTGYGRGERQVGDLLVSAEVRSVNHRFLDLKLKLPPDVLALESELRRRVSKQVARGRIDLGVTLQRGNGAPHVHVNRPLVRGYVTAVRALRDEIGLSGDVDLRLLLQIPGVVRLEANRSGITRKEAVAVRAAIDAAIGALSEAREREGARLEKDLRQRLAIIKRRTVSIRKRARGLAPQRAERLRQRVARLAEGVSVEPARLAQEVAFLADRSDVEEELVRLDSHLEAMTKLLDGSGKPSGKELDFLTQELHRETNTIGSKAGDLSITQATLAIKSEVEKIREQVANVE